MSVFPYIFYCDFASKSGYLPNPKIIFRFRVIITFATTKSLFLQLKLAEKNKFYTGIV